MKIVTKIVIWFILLSAPLHAANLPKPDNYYTKLRITTRPIGAKIFINGQYMGDTSNGTLKWRRFPIDKYTITVRKDGYKEQSIKRQLSQKINKILFELEVVDDKGYSAAVTPAIKEQKPKFVEIKPKIKRKKKKKKKKKISKTKKSKIKIETVLVDGGCFEMVDYDVSSDSDPIRQNVCVDDFFIGKYEVTQGEWIKIMGINPSKFNDCGYNCPVESVSWNDVMTFIEKLNAKTGENYRLPTEAEWEYAARSGGNKDMFSGFSEDYVVFKYANFCDTNCESSLKTSNQDDGYKNTAPVGLFRSNALGLYDMTGNVWEWCIDWYGDYKSKKKKMQNPKGPGNGIHKIIRGGSWKNSIKYLDVAFRNKSIPSLRHPSIGFRLVLDRNNNISSSSSIKPVKQTPMPKKAKIKKSKRKKKKKYIGTYEPVKKGNFLDYNNGTIVDKKKNLIWEKEDYGDKFKWKKAVKVCKNIVLAGYTNWRLPTKEELSGLVNEKNTPTIDPIFSASPTKYWTSTTRPGDVGGAYYVDFKNGLSRYFDKKQKYSIRCVHDK